MGKLGQHTDISQHDIMLPPSTRLQIDYENKIKEAIEKQKAIENYNKQIHNIDPVFKTKKFTGNTVIVRLFKNNYIDMSKIKDLENITEKDIIHVLPSAKEEIESDGGKLHIIDNPLNYNLRGVIIALSDIVKEKSEKDIGVKLEVGQIVELDSFSNGTRYYPDKSKFDIKMKMNDIIRGENPYINYEGYFKTTPFNIEAVIIE
ncbi:MAG: hypothetical protein KatS3mg002_1359 [Candidatus Woesearchaeota archaeon]|nr:MAG: hypothetical protein KatS3mg002_1359 [Candidatus Woesearchaeota archaeon]